ncbi:methyltransferase [Salinimonas sediminis]|uniref:tRNA 5-carboxymethoxyuridine methyltransferase n=1 Tax=Salinimonas sediminis TaxID=2303538 RepID=A0A346NLV4_9ALTE|nr:methyltransferase [Salinimonas sediminis]AXR06511.1 methyltransferase [Salinimonas sediminis]
MKETDRYFNGIADKFARNIYGTTKGKLRHLLLLEAMQPFLEGGPQHIIELGGGTGIMARALLALGHNVTLTDASEDVLALARELLVDYPQAKIAQATLQSIDNLADYDMVVCHAVLEWLADPLATLTRLSQQMRPGSVLSVSFFNRDAALFQNAVYGNFDYIARGMKVKNQVRLNPDNALAPREVIHHVTQAGFEIAAQSGIRCFHDYMQHKPDNDEVFAQLLALERQYGQQAPFCWLGKYFHLMLRKPDKPAD